MSAPMPPADPDERLWAVFIEPQLARFREVYGLRNTPLHASFTGWRRYVVHSPDRCFAVPRHPEGVAAQRREATALASLDHPLVPRFVELREDPGISPYPLLVTARLSGRPLQEVLPSLSWDGLLRVLSDLGRATAHWHDAPVPHGLTAQPHPHEAFAAECTPTTVAERAQAAATQAGLPDSVVRGWLDRLAGLMSLPHVLVHGDIHEGQVLVDDAGAISAVLDWETAGPCHPAKDFDLGEWDRWIFSEHENDFAALREAWWSSYTTERGIAVDSAALHLFFTITDMARVSRGPAQSGDAWRERRLRALTSALRAAA